MKNQEIYARAAILLGAIGEIDEGYLQEAMTYAKAKENGENRIYAPQIREKKKRFGRAWKIAIPIAAAFLTLTVAGVSLLFSAMFRAGSAPKSAETYDGSGKANAVEHSLPDGVTEGENRSEAPAQSAETVDRILKNATPARVQTGNEAPAGDGNTYLVWRVDGETPFAISRALTADEAAALTAEVERLPSAKTDDVSPKTAVWILHADGTVTALLSPDAPAGTTFFAHTPTRLPTDRLAEILSGIV